MAQVLVVEWFCKFGVPVRIHSYQGCNFESFLIQQLCGLYGVEKSRRTPYHPAGNGQCERFNRTLHYLLRTLPVSRKRHWHSCLPQVLFPYNTTPHQSTGESPFFLMFGQEPRLPMDFLLGRVTEPVGGAVHEWIEEHQVRLQIALEGAHNRLSSAAECRNRNNARHVRDTCLVEGQLVWLRDFSARGRHKSQDLWGPTVYRVLRVPEVGDSVYTVAPLEDLTKVKRVSRLSLKAAVGLNLPEGAAPAPTSPSSDRSSSGDELRGEDGLCVLAQEPARVTGPETTTMAVTTMPHRMGSNLGSPTPGPSTAPTAVIADRLRFLLLH